MQTTLHAPVTEESNVEANVQLNPYAAPTSTPPPILPNTSVPIQVKQAPSTTAAAAMRTKDNKRTTVSFYAFNFDVMNDPAKKVDSVTPVRGSLFKLFTFAKEVDATIVIYVFSPLPTADPFAVAITPDMITDSAFPRSLNQLEKYFNRNFRVRQEDGTYPIYTSCKLGINGDAPHFLKQLSEFASKHLNGRFEVSPIQHANTTDVGWLAGLPKWVNGEDIQSSLTFQFNVLNRDRADQKNRRPAPPPIAVQ
jgi:hypothetical protein